MSTTCSIDNICILSLISQLRYIINQIFNGKHWLLDLLNLFNVIFNNAQPRVNKSQYQIFPLNIYLLYSVPCNNLYTLHIILFFVLQSAEKFGIFKTSFKCCHSISTQTESSITKRRNF